MTDNADRRTVAGHTDIIEGEPNKGRASVLDGRIARICAVSGDG